MNGRLCRRVTALVLILAFFTSIVPAAGSADTEPTPYQDMLNAVLNGERSWVTDTLVNDNRATNPIAILNGRQGGKSLAKDALDRYRGIDAESQTYQAIYRGMVSVMDKVYNADEYVGTLIDAAGKIVAWAANLFSSSQEIALMLDDLTASRDELHYDSLLKGMFTKSYTASDGTTLQELEGSLGTVQAVKNYLKIGKSLNSLAKSWMSSYNDPEDPDASYGYYLDGELLHYNGRLRAFSAEYIEDFAIPLEENAESFLNSIGKVAGKSRTIFNTTPEASARIAANLAMIAQLSIIAPQSELNGFSYREYINELLLDYEAKDLLSISGFFLNYSYTAADTYIYLNSIQQQKEWIAGPLYQIAGTTDDMSIRDSVRNFDNLLREEYDKSLLSWDTIQRYLRENQVVSKKLSKAVKSYLAKSLHLTRDYALGATLADLVAVVSISSWAADQVVGLKETCKKTYELLYWERFKELSLQVYRDNLEDYQNSPSEETAETVIQDLLFLQKVQLYGEKIAFDLVTAPNDSWLGSLYDCTEIQENWEKEYQYRVDELMAASVLPPITGITVKSGSTMIVRYREDIGYYAVIDGVDYIDLPVRLSGGLTLNGTLIVDNPLSTALGIGFISAGNGAVIQLKNGDLCIGELEQEPGSIRISLGNNSTIRVTENLTLYTAACSGGAPGSIVTKNAELHGNAQMTIQVSGDVTGVGGGAETIIMTGEKGRIDGTLNVGTLRLQGSAAEITGKISVTDTLYGPAVSLTGARNIEFSGDTIETGIWNGDLTVRNAALNGVRIKGSLFDKGGTTYNSTVTVDKALSCTGESMMGSGDTLQVYGSAWFSKPIAGAGKLRLWGDLSTADNLTLPQEITLCGKVSQGVSGVFAVDTIHFANTGSVGITVRDTVTVTRLLDNPVGKVTAETPIFLGDTALVAEDFRGTISVLNWTPKNGAVVSGDLIIRDGGTVTGERLTVGGTLTAEGTAILDGCAVQVGGLRSNTALTLENGAVLTANGPAELRGTLSSLTELTVNGDLFVARFSTDGALRVRGDVTVQENAALGTLTLDGTFVQEIAGADFTVENLNILNSSGRPLRLGQTITVTGCYSNPACEIRGGKIKGGLETTESVTADKTLSGDLILVSPLTVTGCTLTVNGRLSAKSITLVNSTLVVNGSLSADGLTLEGSILTVDGDITLSGGACLLDGVSLVRTEGTLYSPRGTIVSEGSLEVRGDLILEDTTLTGGTVILGGDLYGNASLQPGSLCLNGKTRQRISAGGLTAGDMTLANPSRGGILLEKQMKYTGEFLPGNTALFNAYNLVKEAE